MKPCPFCGSEHIRTAEDGLNYAQCLKCGAYGPSATNLPPPEYGYTQGYLMREGNRLWNERAENEEKA